MSLTKERLNALLKYNPRTGVWRWIVSKASRAMPGDVAGAINATGYRYICIDGKKYKAHRLAWLTTYGDWPPEDIDHINDRRHDNRIANLRLATRSQNIANGRKHKDGSSKYNGVGLHGQTGKWRARICKNGVTINLGLFTTQEDAHAAYCKAAKELFAKFARVA